jgi:MFS family permease
MEDKRKTLFHGGVLSALGERDYALTWSGALISNIGTWVQTAALLWFVKNVFGTNFWVGAVNMANFVPVLFVVPFAGSFADRYNRRWVIIYGQIVMMVGALMLGIAASLGLDNKAVIIVTVAIIGVAFAFNFPAWQALLPDLVNREDLLNAIALSSAQWNLARFIGPVIGAAILAYFSASTAFYVNAASFLFVIVALLYIHPSRGHIEKSDNTLWGHMRLGWTYVWHRRWMVNILAALGLVSFFGYSYFVLVPSLVQDVLNRGSAAYGFLLGLTGLGAVLGAPLVTVLSRHVKERDIFKIATLALGLGLIAFAASRTYWLSCIISVILGAAYLVTGAAVNSVLQGCSEREMRGRVISFYIMVYIGVFAVGGQFMGFLADLLESTPWSLFIGGVGCVLVAAILTFVPGLIREAVYQGRETCRQPVL